MLSKGAIVTATDVVFNGRSHEKNTRMAVVERPKPDQTPAQVDPETARRWLRDGWATESRPDVKK
jgi:hypothetical protein